MATDVPSGPLLGLKPAIVGACEAPITVNVCALVTAPLGVVTVIAPEVAPEGTDATI